MRRKRRNLPDRSPHGRDSSHQIVNAAEEGFSRVVLKAPKVAVPGSALAAAKAAEKVALPPEDAALPTA